MAMAEPSWKRFERTFAAAVGARRYWANSGAHLDFEGPHTFGQCKEVRRLSLAELTALAEAVAQDPRARTKLGIVGVKLRRGAGRKSEPLVVLTLSQFSHWYDWRCREKKEPEKEE